MRVQLETAPSGARNLLEAIADHAASSDSPCCLLDLEPPGRTSDLIPLAGILLDYATAYCVSSEDGSNCLGGRELYLIEAFSVTAGGQRSDTGALPLTSYNIHSMADLLPSFALPGTPSSRSRTPPRLSPPRPRWNQMRSSPKSIANFRHASAKPNNDIQNWSGSLWRLNTVQSRWIRLHCNRSLQQSMDNREVRKAGREKATDQREHVLEGEEAD